MVIALVPFFNVFRLIPPSATRNVALSRARDIGDSTNDCLGNLISVFISKVAKSQSGVRFFPSTWCYDTKSAIWTDEKLVA